MRGRARGLDLAVGRASLARRAIRRKNAAAAADVCGDGDAHARRRHRRDDCRLQRGRGRDLAAAAVSGTGSAGCRRFPDSEPQALIRSGGGERFRRLARAEPDVRRARGIQVDSPARPPRPRHPRIRPDHARDVEFLQRASPGAGGRSIVRPRGRRRGKRCDLERRLLAPALRRRCRGDRPVDRPRRQAASDRRRPGCPGAPRVHDPP